MDDLQVLLEKLADESPTAAEGPAETIRRLRDDLQASRADVKALDNVRHALNGWQHGPRLAAASLTPASQVEWLCFEISGLREYNRLLARENELLLRSITVLGVVLGVAVLFQAFAQLVSP